ncbi:MAG: hypothetical protein ACAI35_22230 [Candidatus Methylacidiphilales bacterium]
MAWLGSRTWRIVGAIVLGATLFVLTLGLWAWANSPVRVRWFMSVSSMAWSPRGDELAVGYADGSLEILTCRACRVVSSRSLWISGNKEGSTNNKLLKRLEWSPDGSMLAVGYHEGAMIVDVKDGSIVQDSVVEIGEMPSWKGRDWAWSPDSRRLITACQIHDGHSRPVPPHDLVVWEKGSGLAEPKNTLVQYERNFLSTFSWSPDGEFLAANSSKGLALLNMKTDKAQTLAGSSEYWHGISWSPDGTRIACCVPVDEGGYVPQDRQKWLLQIWSVDRRESKVTLLHSMSIPRSESMEAGPLPETRWSSDGKLVSTFMSTNYILDASGDRVLSEDIVQVWMNSTTGKQEKEKRIRLVYDLLGSKSAYFYAIGWQDAFDPSPSLDRLAVGMKYSVSLPFAERDFEFCVIRLHPSP